MSPSPFYGEPQRARPLSDYEALANVSGPAGPTDRDVDRACLDLHRRIRRMTHYARFNRSNPDWTEPERLAHGRHLAQCEALLVRLQALRQYLKRLYGSPLTPQEIQEWSKPR